MRSMLDSDYDDMLGVDVIHDFDHACFESKAVSDDDECEAECDSVLLECNGELLDVGSVKLLGARKSACGFEALLFICPRCKEAHESVRFR
jgi:hypothetical protein